MKYLISAFIFLYLPFVNAANAPVDSIRYQAFIQQIRCVVCQNENIADSSAPLAEDLRKKIYLLMSEQKSNLEIKDYLVKRYGEFILLQPAVNTHTFLLWGFPLLGLVGAAFVLNRLRRRHVLN